MHLKKLILCPLAILLALLSVFLTPILILFFGFFRWIIPNKNLKKIFSNCIESSALSWVWVSHIIFRYLLQLDIHIIGGETIIPKKNYFIIANHQSWIDILMLEEALYQRTGFSRYFIKKNLTLIPLAGWACHVLNYPYMYRFSKEHLSKHPQDKGKDIEITKRACQKLKGVYLKMNNFPEGTRFTTAKHDKQHSPYQNLLIPKTGGIAYALEILHDQFDALIDMTIIFSKKPNITRLFLGNIGKVTIVLKKIPITPDLIGNYQDDPKYRAHIQNFITQLWKNKDALINEIGDYRKERLASQSSLTKKADS